MGESCPANDGSTSRARALALRHDSQLSGDGARDDAGSELRGGRAPVFALIPVNPDEGQEGGEVVFDQFTDTRPLNYKYVVDNT